MHKLFQRYLVSSAALLLCMLVGLLLVNQKTRADEPTTWLNSTLTLSPEGDLPTGVPIPYAINGNRDCQEHKFVKRPSRLLQTEQSHLACGVQSRYGLLDPNGWLELNGTTVSGMLVNYSGGGYSPGVIPIPSSANIINYSSAPSGLYLHITKNLPGALTAAVSGTGEATYQINRLADYKLRDKSGALLQVHPDSLSFSSTGEWAIVDGRYKSMLRFNTETGEVLPFAPTFNYDTGIAPSLQTAISSDGRYAVVFSKPFGVFKIYDLITCGPVPNSITAPVACQSRDLLPIMQARAPGFQGVSGLRFISSDAITFYANYNPTPGVASTNRVAKFSLGVSGNIAARMQFLALGDSYISGEGAYEYKAGTDTDVNHCHLSLVSYPYLVSNNLSFNSYNSVSCSGARTWDMSNNDGNYAGQLTSGEKRSDIDETELKSILSSYAPGTVAQLDFVTYYRPQSVVVSIGGNDVGFSNILRRCLEPDTCFGTYEDRLELVRLINSKFPSFVDTYKKIKEATVPSAKIYAVAYPQIAKPDGNCALNVHLNNQELIFANQLTTYLNTVLRAAADKAGIVLVDTENALDGHKMCQTKSSDVAVNGLTAGNSYPSQLKGPLASESYHPNKLGHQLLADKVLSESQNLSKTMPSAVSTISSPGESGLEILNAPKSGRLIYKVNYDNQLANDVINRETWWNVYLNSLEFSLKAFTPFKIVLNSDPVDLGTFSTDSSGNLSFSVKIPATVPAGFHTLHVYGTNVAGEEIDIYKTIYVSGVDNDACGGVEKSTVDADQDGVDDACDSNIGNPPQVAATPPTIEFPPTSGAIDSDEPPIIVAPGASPRTDANNQFAGATSEEVSTFTTAAGTIQPTDSRVLAATDMTKRPALAGTRPINSKFGPQELLLGGIGLLITLSIAGVVIKRRGEWQ